MRQYCLFTALIVSLVSSGSLHATTIKIATLAPDGTAWMNEMRAAAERTEEKTDGRVKIKFYPGGVMGSAATVQRKIRVGQIQGGAFTGGELATFYPDVYLLNVPFLYRSHEEVAHVREGFDEKLVDGLKDQGWTVLGLSGAGFGYLMSQSPVANRDDLSRQKVWLPEGDPISATMLSLARVNPVTLPLSDVYTGLQTGLIDAVVNTPAGAIAFQWHTRLKHVSDIPVTYVFGGVAVDSKVFSRLSAADQAVLLEEMSGALKTLEKQARSDNESAFSALRNQGLEMVEVSDDELAEWYRLGQKTVEALDADPDLKFDHLQWVRDRLKSYRESN